MEVQFRQSNLAPEIGQVALLGDDYVGMKPTLLVQEGENVKLGQPVFTDKKTEGVVFTSPAAGKVAAINRCEKRNFCLLVVDVDGDDEITFDAFDSLQNIDRDTAEKQLLTSGLWPAFRTRPFCKVPAPGTEPHSIFVTAMDTNPIVGRTRIDC